MNRQSGKQNKWTRPLELCWMACHAILWRQQATGNWRLWQEERSLENIKTKLMGKFRRVHISTREQCVRVYFYYLEGCVWLLSALRNPMVTHTHWPTFWPYKMSAQFTCVRLLCKLFSAISVVIVLQLLTAHFLLLFTVIIHCRCQFNILYMVAVVKLLSKATTTICCNCLCACVSVCVCVSRHAIHCHIVVMTSAALPS